MGWHGGGRWAVTDEPGTIRSKPDNVLLRRLLSLLLSYKKNFTIVVVSAAVTAAANILGPLFIGQAVDQYIFPQGKLGSNYWGLLYLVALYLGIQVTNYLAEYSQTYFMSIAGQGVIHRLRQGAFDKLQKLSLNYYSERHTGSIISYLTNDMDVLNEFVTFQLPVLFVGAATFLGITAVMFAVNVKLALASLILLPLFAALMLLLQRRIRMSWLNTRKSLAKVTGKLAESISGMRVIQSFSAESDNRQQFGELNFENMRTNLEAAKITSLLLPSTQVIQSVGVAVVFFVGALLIVGGEIQLGVLVAFYIWLNNLFRPVQQLVSSYSQYESALTGLDRVLQIHDAPVEVAEHDNPRTLPDIRGVIDFVNVTFAYKPDQPVLKNLNLSISPGETVAIVGPTGAGKTSLTNLLFRFYDSQEGQILIDGHNVEDLSFSTFRSRMAYVPQEPFLFTGPIAENIRYGRLDASDEEVVGAARIVGADDFISRLPDGYRSVIREDAVNLSTGQKQLISLARAILADPRILVLDEATSRLDPYSELIIQRALEKVFRGRTSIVIAHRLSTIRMANRIVVVDDGRIVEQGTHNDLLLRDGLYARLHEMQVSTVQQ